MILICFQITFIMLKPRSPPNRLPRFLEVVEGSDSGSDNEHKVKRTKGIISYTAFSFGQTIALAALCSSLAAILTAISAVYFLTATNHIKVDDLPRSIVVRTRLPMATTSTTVTPFRNPTTILEDPDDPRGKADYTVTSDNDDGNQLHVAWLMSFPNSGTSFTIHMTREASNCTTATNYALEGEIKDKPSVPVFQGPTGQNGPFLELIPGRHTTIPQNLILTKTHCKGFCNDPRCAVHRTVLTPRSFMLGCLSGLKAFETLDGLAVSEVTYSPKLVKKAIHIFRHPLDNIVARFHLEYNVRLASGQTKYVEYFPKNSTGFQRWCAMDDRNKGLSTHPLVDLELRRMMSRIPCRNEFYRYTQWHNLAFTMSRDMKLPTMLLHYHEYANDFIAARDRVLEFLELPMVGEGIEFQDGKVYRSYYSKDQKRAIREFIQSFASYETWQQVKNYDFELGLVADEVVRTG